MEDLPQELGALLQLEVLDVEQHTLAPCRARGWLKHALDGDDEEEDSEEEQEGDDDGSEDDE